jgi:hypothetical protein
MSARGNANMNKFTEAGHQPYHKQAIIFLNAYWDELADKADDIYEYLQGFKHLDEKEGGCDLDEFYAHKFLESLGQTMTALELRSALRQIDINNDHRMSLLEYLMFKFEKGVDDLIAKSPSGTIDLDVELSPDLVKAINALSVVQAEIARIETKKRDLEEKSAKGGVKGNTAKQELFELLNNDPTELNAALLTAEAAMRKVTKNKDALNIGQGQLWYMNKELEEAKKYQPKGGVKTGKFQ